MIGKKDTKYVDQVVSGFVATPLGSYLVPCHREELYRRPNCQPLTSLKGCEVCNIFFVGVFIYWTVVDNLYRLLLLYGMVGVVAGCHPSLYSGLSDYLLVGNTKDYVLC